MKPVHEIEKFIMAGNAYFTLRNEKTGNRYTFRIKAKRDGGFPHFVSVLNGSDNTNSYAFLGTIFPAGNYKPSLKSIFNDSQAPQQVFNWFWIHKNRLPDGVNVYHEGRCGRCGRLLTVPESILSGFGPECIQRIS